MHEAAANGHTGTSATQYAVTFPHHFSILYNYINIMVLVERTDHGLTSGAPQKVLKPSFVTACYSVIHYCHHALYSV